MENNPTAAELIRKDVETLIVAVEIDHSDEATYRSPRVEAAITAVVAHVDRLEDRRIKANNRAAQARYLLSVAIELLQDEPHDAAHRRAVYSFLERCRLLLGGIQQRPHLPHMPCARCGRRGSVTTGQRVCRICMVDLTEDWNSKTMEVDRG